MGTFSCPQSVFNTGSVDVWVLGASVLVPSEEAALHSYLSTAELQRMRRFFTPALQQQYLLARVMVRRVLARYCSVTAEHLQFVSDNYGRPHIVSSQMPDGGLYFSLSHTEGCMLLAVSSNPAVGVDVEDRGRAVNAHALAKRFFSYIDVAQLERSTAQQYLNRFWMLWVLKEAYVKAQGLGMRLDFRSFGFSNVAHAPVLMACSVEGARARHEWQVQVFQPSTVHVAALCSLNVSLRTRFFELRDLTTMNFKHTVYESMN